MSRIYFCTVYAGDPEMKVFKGPDPKIKNPKAPKKTKKGGKMK